jgi:hypothetical protein
MNEKIIFIIFMLPYVFSLLSLCGKNENRLMRSPGSVSTHPAPTSPFEYLNQSS